MRGFMFPGQGSQYVGMGQKLYQAHAAARAVFEEASDALQTDMARLIFEGDDQLLALTEWTQPALLTVGVAAYRSMIEQTGVHPEWMLGHSLGEITALTCASSIRLADAARIVRFRGRAMQDCVQQEACIMMAVHGMEADQVLAVCAEDGEEQHAVRAVAAINSPAQVVLSGLKDRVLEWKERLEAMGGSLTPLKVSAPFHSPLMAPAADALKEHLEQYTFAPMSCKVISNVTARPYESADQIVTLLTQQVTEPVRWQQSIQYLLNQGVGELVDLGPGTVMKRLAEANGASRTVAIERDEEWGRWLAEVSGSATEPVRAVELAVNCLRHAVSTPNLNWNEEEYDQGVVQPIRLIQAKLKAWEEEGASFQPERAELEELLRAIQLILNTKRLAADEQARRLGELLQLSGLRELPDMVNAEHGRQLIQTI
ncbi:[acyl-carrier-protein] S-malonyltransferase [Paenibacillus phyllosphaerae]|uniref:[acyl-carrier-protein] S-malonyltransferase n=1 Tax=Paenibacillus phyllosphaerae TaxID=274593 RepID=A0A7W5ASJ5_9BACL|nr:ACP S-malonyltransferase [Paenibacillus phyllosphaerae]MBB3107974.1 [acyl-carrier-protein] S-malonyltransferase [Paenibacillus phyllosphaerae]